MNIHVSAQTERRPAWGQPQAGLGPAFQKFEVLNPKRIRTQITFLFMILYFRNFISNLVKPDL